MCQEVINLSLLLNAYPDLIKNKKKLGSETHFEVTIISDKFDCVKKIEVRLINSIFI